MKQIVIVRHGKAVPFGYENDFNRDLRDRGKNDAALIGKELKDRNVIPDLIVSSPAKRALKTARIFADHLDYPQNKIHEEQDIYDGMSTSEFIEFVQELPESAETVFFFGHNPGFYYFAANLLKEFRSDMPTTSTVGINLNVDDWSKVEARNGDLAFHLMPRMFK